MPNTKKWYLEQPAEITKGQELGDLAVFWGPEEGRDFSNLKTEVES